MRIVFLHGFESTPNTSSSAKFIKENFENVYIPDYNPKDSYENIKNRLSELTEDDIVIGISMGGFWALHLTEFTSVYNIILLNPAIQRGSERYNVNLNTPNYVGGHLILNMDDNIVDNNWNCKQYEKRFLIDTFQIGGHRMNNMNEIIPLIKNTIDHFENTYII